MPCDVYALSPGEYKAMVTVMIEEYHEIRRAQRQRGR